MSVALPHQLLIVILVRQHGQIVVTSRGSRAEEHDVSHVWSSVLVEIGDRAVRQHSDMQIVAYTDVANFDHASGDGSSRPNRSKQRSLSSGLRLSSPSILDLRKKLSTIPIVLGMRVLPKYFWVGAEVIVSSDVGADVGVQCSVMLATQVMVRFRVSTVRR